MKISVSYGGGGLKWSFHCGLTLRLLDKGHEIVSADGVSAGALAAALVGQQDWDLMRRTAWGTEPPSKRFPALTRDVHRLKTGVEILRELFPRGLKGVDEIARNDRAWTNYIKVYIDANLVTIPVFVGAVDWDTGAYLSIAHSDGEWPEAVYGSATMPPPLWKPVKWRGHRLVDGGLRSTVPVDDVMLRIVKGEQAKPDLVLAVPTSRTGWTGAASSGLEANLMHTIGILTDQVMTDDLARKPWWPDVECKIAWPIQGLGETLDSSVELQRSRFTAGELAFDRAMTSEGV